MPRPLEFDRTKVVKQAMELFWQHGYEATSISDLTAATRLKPGSLYNTFGSKQALYLEALDYYIAGVRNPLFDVLSEPISGVEAIRRLFKTLVDGEFHDLHQRGCMLQKALLERAVQDAEVKARVRRNMEQGKAAFKRALVRAYEANELSEDLDLDQAAGYLMSMVQGIRIVACTTESKAELNGIAEMVLVVLR